MLEVYKFKIYIAIFLVRSLLFLNIAPLLFINMEERIINLTSKNSIYIEKNEGKIYVGENYVEDPSSAFCNASYELLDYTPTIEPAIRRNEVEIIQEWIERKASTEKASRLALLYGKAGIGKSIVMHDLLEQLQSKNDYLVFGLKSDQVEFVNTDDLSRKIHLAQPIETVVKDMAQKYKRVVLLIDQIDALSLSLSSNRTPLRSLLKVISQVQYIPNVRVVISCRPYDLEYDPLLDNLRIKNKWELKELTKEQVQQTLKNNQCKERLSDNLLRFLGNPLHLYLFLKIRPYEQLTNPLSTDLLYHQLWRKYVNDDSIRKVEKERLLSLLDSLVGTMYHRQELSVHIRKYETDYDSELKYLFTNGFLIVTKNGLVQFFHQTLFDYVYARRFTEKGNDLLEELKKQHQGLFSRPAVKSILIFQRELQPSVYIHIIEQLLYAKDEKGKDIYRFHLKSLALSNIPYFELPLKEELNFILRKVYSNKVYMDVIFESVYTVNWFNAIWGIIDSNGGWKKLSKEYKEKTMVMCQRTLLFDAEVVLDKLDSVLDYGDENDCKHLQSLLQYNNLNCESNKLVTFYNKLVKKRNPLEYINLLRNILNGNPTFVCNELKENIKLQLKEEYSYKIIVPHDVGHLYEELLNNYHELAIQLLVDILNIVYEETQIKLKGFDIYSSTKFFSFQRTTGGHFISNFVEDVVNILIDDFLRNARYEKTKHYIAEFSKSRHEGLVFIALYIYTSHPELFKDDIYKIIMSRQVLANAPSWVEYQAIEALRTAYPLMNKTQKVNVISRILDINDEREYYQKYKFETRLQYGHPLSDVDLHKGKALEVIPMEELKTISWIAYQERQRIDRKFNLKRLVNEKPSCVSSHMGWTSLKEDQGLKMNCAAWFKSMLTYTNNDIIDWKKPSLTGQCHLFRDVVSKEPEKFIDLINQIILDDRILLVYPEAGMQGLIDAGRLDDAMQVLQGILSVINDDVNSEKRSFSIHSLLFALNDIIKQEHVPEIVIRLLCNTLINAKEPEEDNHQEDKDAYNVGINQVRGHAGYMLVKCAYEDKYKEEIFGAIESVAESASVYTRAAILLNMAILNLLDENRSVILFKMLMHDYNPRLMAMPVHNYNPLVYFVNYAVDDMMEFFYHAVECAKCYPEQVIVLWLAWSHNDRDERIKVLLDKMCDTSQEARISLLRFLCSLDNNINEEAIYYILYFMEPQFNSFEMGEACDNIFYHINKWPEEIWHRIADTYVNSPLCKHQIRAFIEFLGSYAIKDPVQTLKWLERILDTNISDDYLIWNKIMDVVIQSYNGIKSFNDSNYQETLEKAMDLIDTIMQNPNNKYLISNFINKLDNE